MDANKTRNGPPAGGLDDDEPVSLVVRADGVPTARGRGFGRLSPEAQDYLLNLEAARAHREHIEAEIGLLVAGARRAGASWHSVGLSLATTGEAARKRYLFVQEDDDE